MIFGYHTVVDYKKLANSVLYTDINEKSILQAGEAGWMLEDEQMTRLKEDRRRAMQIAMGSSGF